MRRILALAVLLFVCVGCFAGVGAAAHEEPDRSVLAFELDAEGSAVVYHIRSYDLNDTDERASYESVADNESRRSDYRDAVVDELTGAAADGRNRTELDMRIRNGSIEVFERDGYGRVVVRAEWATLAYHNETRVAVTEPFRGGYEPDLNNVAIHGPDGYRRGPVQPSPVRARGNSAVWNPQTSNFSAFYAGFEDASAGGSEGSGGTGGDDGAGGDGDGSGAGDDGDGAGGESGDSGSGDGADGNVVVFLQALLLALVPVAAVLLAVRRRR